MRTFIGSVGLIGVLLSATATASASESRPTFTEDIAPILFQHCASCHRPDQIAPFSLLTYEDAKKRSSQLATITARRIMPPWKPAPGWGEFHAPRTLTDTQIAVFQKWSDAGAPRGDAKHLPPLPKFKNGWQLGKPDMIVKMPKPFTVPAEGRDVYVHFVFPLNLTKDVYLRGIETIPSNKRVAHHAVGILDTRGIALAKAKKNDGVSYVGNDPGFLPAGYLPGFVPGQTPTFLADGEAIVLKKGTDLVLQMHYSPSGKEEIDQTSIGLYFTDKPPKRNVSVFLMGAVDIDIPPGESAYRKSDAFTLPADYEVRNIWAHMHLIGRDIKVWAELPDKTTKKLLRIDDWDFNWQDSYLYAKPFILPKGTVVKAEFSWDNSEANPSNPSRPPIRVVHGEQSANEMAGLIIGGVPVRPRDEIGHWLAVIGHYFEMEARKLKVRKN